MDLLVGCNADYTMHADWVHAAFIWMLQLVQADTGIFASVTKLAWPPDAVLMVSKLTWTLPARSQLQPVTAQVYLSKSTL